MPKPILPSKIKSALLNKGFKEEEARGHKLLRLYVNGKKTGISTSLSRGSRYREYGMDLLNYMTRGLRLDITRQLVNLIECPMSYTQYITYLRERKGLRLG